MALPERILLFLLVAPGAYQTPCVRLPTGVGGGPRTPILGWRQIHEQTTFSGEAIKGGGMTGGPRALPDGFEAKIWVVQEPQWLTGQGRSAPGEGTAVQRPAGGGDSSCYRGGN